MVVLVFCVGSNGNANGVALMSYQENTRGQKSHAIPSRSVEMPELLPEDAVVLDITVSSSFSFCSPQETQHPAA